MKFRNLRRPARADKAGITVTPPAKKKKEESGESIIPHHLIWLCTTSMLIISQRVILQINGLWPVCINSCRKPQLSVDDGSLMTVHV